MIKLDEEIFGRITAKEIMGEDPPLQPDTRTILEHEFELLKKNLDLTPKNEIKQLLENQIQVEKLMNSRPGAMALSQPKIRLFTEFSQKYIQIMQQKLDSYIQGTS